MPVFSPYTGQNSGSVTKYVSSFPWNNTSYQLPSYVTSTFMFSSSEDVYTSSVPYTESLSSYVTLTDGVTIKVTAGAGWSRQTISSGAYAYKQFSKCWYTQITKDVSGNFVLGTAANVHSYTSDSTNWAVGTGNAGAIRLATDGAGGIMLSMYNAGGALDPATYTQYTTFFVQIETYYGLGI